MVVKQKANKIKASKTSYRGRTQNHRSFRNARSIALVAKPPIRVTPSTSATSQRQSCFHLPRTSEMPIMRITTLHGFHVDTKTSSETTEKFVETKIDIYQI